MRESGRGRRIERQTDSERVRQKERRIERQTDRERDRQREKERKTDGK